MNTLYSILSKLETEGTPFAIVTVLDATVNSPGRRAFKMAVTATESYGSIGGGGVEYKMQKVAREMLRSGGGIRKMNEDFNDQDGIGCGGSAEILIEAVIPRPRLIIYGGGHIGSFLASYAGDAGFDVTIYDDRPQYATTEGHPGVSRAICAPYEDVPSADLPANAYHVIVTHQHTGDRACLEGILRRPELAPAYVGCIGSAVKLGYHFKDMVAAGVPRASLERVHAPIGVDNGGDSAAEIAIAIADELISVRRGHPIRDTMSAKKHPLKGGN